MEQNIENQIRILEDTQDQPTRFCFEFPLDVSLFQYFLSKGQQCLTYKQEILLNGLLSGNSLLYKVFIICLLIKYRDKYLILYMLI